MKENKKIKALIFDLGGVIVDLDWQLCVDNFKKIGINEMENLLSTTMQKDFVLDYELGNISSEKFREKLRQYTQNPVTDKELNYAWQSLLIKVPQEKLALLKELRKYYKVYMLSNTNEMSYQKCLDEMFNVNGNSVDDYFDKCFLSYQLHICKPNKEIFEYVLNKTGFQADECLFLDDGVKNIEAAKLLGIHARLVKPSQPFSLSDFDVFE